MIITITRHKHNSHDNSYSYSHDNINLIKLYHWFPMYHSSTNVILIIDLYLFVLFSVKIFSFSKVCYIIYKKNTNNNNNFYSNNCIISY